MIKPIKLTEDDIYIILDKDNNHDCRIRFNSLEGYEIIWTPKQAIQIKQQILENQEKLEKISLIIKSESESAKNPEDYCHCTKPIPSGINSTRCQTCGLKLEDV